jgi:hypothetical protein
LWQFQHAATKTPPRSQSALDRHPLVNIMTREMVRRLCPADRNL